jgi:hypothetical protein
VFSLQLKNFLLQTSIAVRTVTVTANQLTPTVSIAGSAGTLLYRYQPLTLYAIANVPTCTSSSASASASASANSDVFLTYEWSVYRGVSFISTIKSTSLDARFFKLSAYSLDSGVSYTVEVKVTASSTSSSTTSTTTSTTTSSTSKSSVLVQVGRAGVFAIIAGR